MPALRCSNSSQSFPKLSDQSHVYLGRHKWCHKEYLTWTILQRILILYPISGIYILQEWNHCWSTIYTNHVHRLHGSPLFLHHSENNRWKITRHWMVSVDQARWFNIHFNSNVFQAVTNSFHNWSKFTMWTNSRIFTKPWINNSMKW